MKRTRIPISCIFAALTAVWLVPRAAVSGTLPCRPAVLVVRDVPAHGETALSLFFEPFGRTLSEQMRGNMTGGASAESADAVMVWDSETQRFVSAYKSSADGLWYGDMELATPAGFDLAMGAPFWLRNVGDAVQTVAFGGLLPPVEVLASNSCDVFSVSPSVFSPGYNLFGSGSAFPVAMDPGPLVQAGAAASADPLEADKVLPSRDGPSLYLSPLDGAFVWRDAAGGVVPPPVVAPAQAWWYVRAGAGDFALPGISVPPSGWPLGEMGVADIRLSEGGAVLTVFPPEDSGAILAVLYRDNPASLAELTAPGWKVLAEGLCPEAGQPFTLVDVAAAARRSAGDMRVYAVIRAGADSDGDGLTDEIERLVTGTDPSLTDTDGDNVTDAADASPLIPSPAGGDPSKVAFWLKAECAQTNAAGEVVSWKSVSPGGAVFMPGGPTNAPAFVPDADNRAWVEFDGACDALRGVLAPGSGPLTLFAVVRFSQPSQGEADHDCVFNCGDVSRLDGHLCLSRGSADCVKPDCFYTLNGLDRTPLYGPRLEGGVCQAVTVDWPTGPGAANRVAVNGIDLPCAQGPQVSPDYACVGIGALAEPDGGMRDFLRGGIAEMILVRGEVSDAERSAVQRYLVERFGINNAPRIGMPEALVLPAGGLSAEFETVITDDGMPPGGEISCAWASADSQAVPQMTRLSVRDEISGNSVTRTIAWRAVLPVPGARTLRLTASDGMDASSAEVLIFAPEPMAALIPTDGLKLWIRSDAVSAADVAPVRTLFNLAPGGGRLAQESAEAAPVFTADRLDGRPSLVFDGTNDWLAGAIAPGKSPLTVVAVARYAQETQPDGDSDCILTLGDGAIPNWGQIKDEYGGVKPYALVSMGRYNSGWENGNAGGASKGKGNGGGGGDREDNEDSNRYYCWLGHGRDGVSGPVLPGRTWLIQSAVHLPEEPRHGFSLNGYGEEAEPYGKSVLHDGHVELGRYLAGDAPDHYFNGEIAEALVFDRRLTEAETAALEFYLGRRYGLWNGSLDADGDGILDNIEAVLGTDLEPLPEYALPFRERFETNTVPASVSVDGRNGWLCLSNTFAFTQTNILSEGERALQMDTVRLGPGLPDAFVSHPFACGLSPTVWLDMDAYMLAGREPTEAFIDAHASAALFYFKSPGVMRVYDGKRPDGERWADLPLGCGPTCRWARVTAALDYRKQEWLVCADGSLLASGLGFARASAGLSGLSFSGQKGFFDNVAVDTTVPAGVSADGDTLEDRWELEVFGCLDYDAGSDPDGDGLSVAEEVGLGTDPAKADTDGDGVPDGWETRHGMNPLVRDADTDDDGDGLNGLEEYGLRTDPHNPDTDGDGISDKAEPSVTLTDPTLSDTDNDGMGDGLEYSLGYNPCESNAYFRVDAGSGRTSWYTGFEPEEGYVKGPIDSVLAWKASSRCVAVTDTDSSTGLQSVEIPPMQSGSGLSERLTGLVGADRRNALWLSWSHKSPASQIDWRDVNTNGAVVLYFQHDRLVGYDGRLRQWVRSAPDFPIDPATFTRFDIRLDYDAKTWLVCVGGRLALDGVSFANPAVTALSSFDFKVSNKDGSAFIDDVSVSVDEPEGLDFDGDGLPNSEEYLLGTDVRSADTDGDTVSDYDEINAYGSDPLADDFDFDHDGLYNAEEIRITKTSHEKPDTDDDGTPDVVLTHVFDGTDASAMTGDWSADGGVLKATAGAGHALDFSFGTEKAGVFRLGLYLSDAASSGGRTAVEVLVDGRTVVAESLALPPEACGLGHTHCSGALTACGICADAHDTHCAWMRPFAAYSPWLFPGPHTLTIRWLPEAGSPVLLAVHKVAVGVIDSPDPRWIASTGEGDGDADGDGLPDVWETAYGLDAGSGNADADTDGDGLTDLEEFLWGFDPADGVWDNDGDGLPDAEEIRVFGTSPYARDSDGDGTDDARDIFVMAGSSATYTHGSWTNANGSLRALDNRTMRAEYALPVEIPGMYRLGLGISNAWPGAATNNLFRVQLLVDAVPVGWFDADAVLGGPGGSLTLPWLTAGAHTLRLAWLDDGAEGKLLGIESLSLQAVDAPDLDGNGLDDWQERILGQNADTDRDGLTDAEEVFEKGTDPLRPDTDGDHLPDGFECASAGTSPLLGDSDGDLVPDAVLLRRLDPRDTLSRDVRHINLVWKDDGALIYNDDAGQLVTYAMDVATAGVYRVELDLRNYEGDIPDDYEFCVETRFDGVVAGKSYVVADVDRTGTVSVATPWLRAGRHVVGFRWLNKDGAGRRSVTVAFEGVRYYGFDTDDLDGNGIADWQEEYLRAAGDTDRDGLSDYDEITRYGSDVLSRDTDGDGISDGDEVAAGLKPGSPDSDGDGVNDWQELHDLGTDPLVSEFYWDSGVLVSADGSSGFGFEGQWSLLGATARCLTWEGAVSYRVTVPAGGYYAFAVVLAGTDPLYGAPQGSLSLSVDGVAAGRQRVVSGTGSVLFFIRLPAGDRTLRLDWNGDTRGSGIAVARVTLQRPGGTDSDGDGVPDWVGALEAQEDGFGATSCGFVSPACVEGGGRQAAFVTLGSSWLPGTGLPGSVPVRQGLENHWYADVHLSPTFVTELAVGYVNGGTAGSVSLSWDAFDVAGPAATNALYIRAGDSLLLAAGVPGGGDAAVEIFREGAPFTNLTVSAASPVPFRFDGAGWYALSAASADGGWAAPVTAGVMVVSCRLPADTFCLAGGTREWPCPELPEPALIETDAGLSAAVATNDAGGISLSLSPKAEGAYTVLARLGGDGPVIDAARVESVKFSDSAEGALRIIEVFSDGSQLVEETLSFGSVPPGLRIELEIFVGGVFFEDGSRIMTVTAADFSADGVFRFIYLRGANVSTSVCHLTRIYDGDTQINN